MGRPYDRYSSIMTRSSAVMTGAAASPKRTVSAALAGPGSSKISTSSTTSPLFGSSSPLSSVFRFTAGPLPTHFVFLPSLSPPAARKRCRPLDDVDGEHSSQSRKKKRRLRLVLITSRLSPVFSQPATYIVDRGSSKIAVWAKQRALGRNLLRKAAIMNCKRVREKQLQQQQTFMAQRQLEMARQTFLKPLPPSAHVPRRDYIPLPPSPLGLSNYDALDLEDELPICDMDDDDDDGSGGDDTFNSSFSSAFSNNPNDGWATVGRNVSASASPPTIYSDFSILDPMESVVDDHDQIEAFAGTSTTAGVSALEEVRNEAERRKQAETKREEERLVEIQAEKERQREVFTRLNDFVVP